MSLLIFTIAIFLSNIPFGYWRANTRKFSVQWFLSIHIPIPFIVLVRYTTDIGFEWTSYVYTVAAFFLGQLFGKVIYKRIRENIRKVSSCLVMDIYRDVVFKKEN